MEPNSRNSNSENPLQDLDQWDDDVRRRYGVDDHTQQIVGQGQGKQATEFRDYYAETKPAVREFYRQNHQHQTVQFVQQKRQQYRQLDRRQMGVWEALEWLTEMVDESDPDTELPQIEHALQTAEAIRRDGHPDWFVLTGLIHDLGKVLSFFGEPQWAVVGDTFPVGCAFSDKIVFAEFFADNPDTHVEQYQTSCGIYEPGCGLDQLMLSWGHDEYMYYVAEPYLPPPALAMIRYHSFYPWHHEGQYRHLMRDGDEQKLEWVRAFNQYDLYTKDHTRPDVQKLRPYYQELIQRYFPESIGW